MALPLPHSRGIHSFGRGTVRICRRGTGNDIVVVALWRPRVKNAVNDDMYLDMIDILAQSSHDSSITAIVLTGAESYFSSGADLKDGNFESEDGRGRDTLHRPAGRFMMALLAFPKVIVAAVQGPAVGIGFTLLLHCDLCLCTEQATFWAPFTRIALVPELCSSATFIETIGLSKANELLLLGKKIDAKTALDWNICSQIVGGCDQSGNPFHENSLASVACQQLDRHLLSLPLGGKTSQVSESW
eukprot:CAMPEP_0116573678 /NCGR_PEP_ID=MMETSP0397-20121206/18930_1 /TAXON_ID=216820 /ORGANISM="Cyclophora tenuis, Strain ECT3854" /LENGTH=243 /DNA_ID=CAMNT_0004102275 /DNA_START=23 /DNA_END=751 /DNA_ORIENTATION=+